MNDNDNSGPKQPAPGTDSRVEDWHGQSVQRDADGLRLWQQDRLAVGRAVRLGLLVPQDDPVHAPGFDGQPSPRDANEVAPGHVGDQQ